MGRVWNAVNPALAPEPHPVALHPLFYAYQLLTSHDAGAVLRGDRNDAQAALNSRLVDQREPARRDDYVIAVGSTITPIPERRHNAVHSHRCACSHRRQPRKSQRNVRLMCRD
jgi:hypothetical protein